MWYIEERREKGDICLGSTLKWSRWSFHSLKETTPFLEGGGWENHSAKLTRQWKVKAAQLCPAFATPWTLLMDSPDQNTGMGSLSLLQEIFPTQGWNPGLPHCRQILYQLSHQGSPRILEWVAYPFSRASSWPRNWTRVSCTAGGLFTSWATREALTRQ